jgi:hypothetical protein
MSKVLSDYDAQMQEFRSLKERALEEERACELGVRRLEDKNSAAHNRVENQEQTSNWGFLGSTLWGSGVLETAGDNLQGLFDWSGGSRMGERSKEEGDQPELAEGATGLDDPREAMLL